MYRRGLTFRPDAFFIPFTKKYGMASLTSPFVSSVS